MTRPEEERRTVAPDGKSEASQPAWRREFPIDAAEDRYIARRDFTKFMVLTSLAFAVGQVWIAVQGFFRGRRPDPEKMAIAPLKDIPVGGVKSFHYPEENDHCLLLRPDEKTLVAYNQSCTHLSCAVVPQMDKGCLHCPCHHGYFDVKTGRPIAGPPRRPLTLIKVEVNPIDGVVYATGVERRTV